jgi:hypothetical protein
MTAGVRFVSLTVLALVAVLLGYVALVSGGSEQTAIRKPPPVCGPLCVGGGIGVGGR